MEKEYCILYSVEKKKGWFGKHWVVEPFVVRAHKKETARKLFWEWAIKNCPNCIEEEIYVKYKKR